MFFFLLFLCYNSRGGKETFAAVRPPFHRDNQFTPSQIFASVYTQEKFTLKFYLINAIIEDKKIDVDFAPERILEKEKRGIEIRAGGPIDKFDVMVFLFSYKEAAERLYSIGKTMDL